MTPEPRIWRRFAWPATILLIVVVYAPVVIHGPVLLRDDKSILTPLESVHGVSDYLQAWREHRILDLQPVRDASFLVDLVIGHLFGVKTFHLTNVLLWCAIVWLVRRLMLAIHGEIIPVSIGVAAFAVHPVFVGSVAWISARKHLLACLFIVAATIVFLRAKTRGTATAREIGTIAGLYLAAVLSQPIVVLWPVWALCSLVLSRSRRSSVWWAVGLCTVAMVVVGAANWLYYSGDYVDATGASKFVNEGETAGAGMLAFGRYFANAIAPISLATQYVPGRWLDVFGLLCFCLLMVWLVATVDRRAVYEWGAFYLFPLIPVTIRMTNIFVSDTYFLTSGVGCLSLVLLGADGMRSLRLARWGTVAAPIVVLVLACASFVQAKTWMSDEALWQQAARVERTPNSVGKYAYYLLEDGHRGDAMRELEALSPQERTGAAAIVYAKAIYTDPERSAKDKAEILEGETPRSPWAAYYLAALEAGRRQYSNAWQLMKGAFAADDAFGEDTGVIAAEAYFFCRNAKASDCEPEIQDVRTRFAGWDERRYQERLASLGLGAK